MLEIDRLGEEFAFENEWDLLIPFTMVRYHGQELQATAIPRVSRRVRGFLSRFAEDPFSDEALAWLWAGIAPKESEWGYRGGKFRWRRCRILRIPEDKPLPAPLPETRVLTEQDGACNLTTYRIAETVASGCLAVGTVIDGRVVSVAVTHEDISELERGDTVEIGVETAPEARGHGYAASALSLATSLLRERGIIPEYRYTRSNRASGAVAARVGYEEVGEACYLLMRRIPRKKIPTETAD